MNRRNAINNIVLLSIGAVVLPSCAHNDGVIVKYNNFSIKDSEAEMLARLSELIIPKTDFIGAADLKAGEFTLMMVDDCYEPAKQKQFVSGLKEFNQLADNKYGKAFAACTPAQKMEWINSIERKKDLPENVLFFYETAKSHTVQAFTSSSQYMTGILKYKLVPGSNFKGCVPVTKT